MFDRTLKDVIGRTDKYLVGLSSETYVFEDGMTRFLVSLGVFACVRDMVAAENQIYIY